MPSKKDYEKECRSYGIDCKGSTVAKMVQLIREYKDLQDRCEAAGLACTGTFAELAQLLKDHENCQENSLCDAVLAAQSMLGGDEDTREFAKKALTEELEKDLEVGHVMGRVPVGNCLGLDLAGMKVEMALFRGMAEGFEAKYEVCEDKINELNDKVATLSLATKEYRCVRNRFVSTYKRDILEKAEEWDHKIIGAGNVAAHGGDAVADALL